MLRNLQFYVFCKNYLVSCNIFPFKNYEKLNIRATMYGWPNTYVFTKAMGEMLVGTTKGNMNVVIVRPTMVTSTHTEPFPGWIEGLR